MSTFATARIRRRIFVSYHHKGDQAYYDAFSAAHHDAYETVTDNSLERRIDSADPSYILRRIREAHLHGSSCLIVLCGAETPKRKFVDWEVYAGLEQGMGLVAVLLPGIFVANNGGTEKPPRVQDNLDSSYAEWAWWNQVSADPGALSALIERANTRSARLIVNTRQRFARNLP